MRVSLDQILHDYRLWAEYVDTDAAMAEDEFDAMDDERKLQLMVEAFGEQQSTGG